MEVLRTAVPLDEAGEVVLLLDGRGVITGATGDVEKMLGQRPADLVGKHTSVIRDEQSVTVPDRSSVFSLTLRGLQAHEREDERRRIYESVLETVADAIVEVDNDLRIRIANQ